MDDRKIIVMFPTWAEAKPFMLAHTVETETWQCGIGASECAARTAAVISSRKPALLILAGTAGARPDSGLSKGETVNVVRENLADLGAVRDNDFHPLPRSGTNPAFNYYTNETPIPALFRNVESDTVNTAGTPFKCHNNAEIENMEGAAFFAVCRRLGVRYAELRCISNYCGEDRSGWIIDQAAKNLAADISMFIAKLPKP